MKFVVYWLSQICREDYKHKNHKTEKFITVILTKLEIISSRILFEIFFRFFLLQISWNSDTKKSNWKFNQLEPEMAFCPEKISNPVDKNPESWGKNPESRKILW